MSETVNRLWGNKRVRCIVIAVLAVTALVSLTQGVRNAAVFSQDFQWDAARTFTMRIDPYDESLHPSGILDAYGFEDYYLQMEANQFPSLLMLLIPYTFLPPLAARYAWIASNLVFTAGIVVLLRQTFLKDIERDLFTVLMLLMIAGTPYRNQLGVGQHTLFAFFFFLLAVWFSDKENRALSFTGTVLCLFVCYFKYTLTVPLCLWFIYKKRYKEIAVSASMHVLLTAVSAWWLDDSFLNMIIKPLRVSGALAAEGGLDLGALFKGSYVSYVLAFLIMAGLTVLALILKSGMDGAFFGVLILWSLIITYHRTYDFFVLAAVPVYFTQVGKPGYLKPGYAAVLTAVFFVLRIFSESTGSRIVVGAMYYIFTVIMTVALVREGTGRDTVNR